MRLRDVLTLPLLGLGLGCQAIADPGVEYVECFRNGKTVELFEGDRADPGAAHCFRTDNVREPAYVQQADGDLIIHPYAEVGAQWTENAQAPFFFRQVTGDFLIVTRAEPVSTTQGEHCLAASEAAGLVVRRAEPFAWATWLVRPNLPDPPPLEQCSDEADPAPTAQVRATSYGFDSSVDDTVTDKGNDGEAYIALCRHFDQLFFFYQDAHPRDEDPLVTLKRSPTFLEVGFGELDVGVSQTAAQGRKTLPEGHFSWLVLRDFAATRPADGCAGALVEFEFPEPDP